MQLFLYTASSIAIAYLASIAVNKKITPQFNLDPKKPFYASIWFFIASITPSIMGIWYLRHYIETKGAIINTPFSLFNFILEENIKAGLGFASLSLLLGVMVARFHASKQNAERINMTLATTQYSNAFSHRKEFNETIKIKFNRPNTGQTNILADTNKLHSYLFSEAFIGSFKSQNIDAEFSKLEIIEKNLIYSLADYDIPTESYKANLKNSLSSMAKFISENNKKIGIDVFDFHYINDTSFEEKSQILTSFYINNQRTDLLKSISIFSDALSLRMEALEKSAHFLPEINTKYSDKLITYSRYTGSIIEILKLINCISSRTPNSSPLNSEQHSQREKEITHAIGEVLQEIFLKNQVENILAISELVKCRNEMRSIISNK